MFAYIPARGGSKRVPRKNIRLLGGKPVLGHVIETLRALDFVSRVHVSTDDPETRAVAESFGAECLEPRDPSLAEDKPGFSDLMREDLPRYSAANGGDSDVLFALATAALVPPEIYEEAHALYRDRRPDLLMACEPYETSAYWALVPKEDGFLRPLFPEMVRINSQDLPPTLTDAGLFYMLDIERATRSDCHKDLERLLPFRVPQRYCVDVDRPEDWARLEARYISLHHAEAET